MLFARKNGIKHIEIDVLAMNSENEIKDGDFWSNYMNTMFSDKQVFSIN